MDAPQPAPPRVVEPWERGEDSAQRPVPTIRYRCTDVGVHLPCSKHGVARQVHERRECKQPPTEGENRPRAFVGDDDGERQHACEQKRVPQRHRRVGEVDVAVSKVGELVPDDGAEGRWICDLADDEPTHQRYRVASRPSEREPGGRRVERVPQPARLFRKPRLVRQLTELVDHGRGFLPRKKTKSAAVGDPAGECEQDHRGDGEEQCRAADHPPGKRLVDLLRHTR